MPRAPTLSAIRQLLAKKRKSTSSPTRNKNNTKPRLAAKENAGMDAVGKMWAVKPGILPMTEGPSRMPVITSAMTRGWRSKAKGQWMMRVIIMTMAAWMMKRMMGFLGSYRLGLTCSKTPP
jgi:hypothetical protein